MKAELSTAIIAAIFGVLIAFFVCNLFFGEIDPISIKTVSNTVNADLDNPDPEIFNFKALNPTVEVYVGSCAEYNDAGDCIDQVSQEEYDTLTEFNQDSATQNSNSDQKDQ